MSVSLAIYKRFWSLRLTEEIIIRKKNKILTRAKSYGKTRAVRVSYRSALIWVLTLILLIIRFGKSFLFTLLRVRKSSYQIIRIRKRRVMIFASL